MKRANPLWGAPRIHGELLKLGLEVSERTVSRWLPRLRKPPSQNWRTFLANHAGDLVSLDFFTAPTLGFRILFVFIVVAHERRRVVHFNVTGNPTALWTAQQMREAFPDDSAPRYLLRDRDGIYGEDFREQVAAMGIREVLTTARSPWQNPFAERLIGSIRRELSRPRDCAQPQASAPHLNKLLGLLSRGEAASGTGQGCADPTPGARS